MKRKLVIGGLVFGMLGVAVAIAWAAYAVSIATEAEHNLLAARCIARSLEGYVWNEGKWPEDFDALEPYGVETLIYRWPEDRDEVLKRVSVDFDLTIEDVATSKAPHRFLNFQTPMYEGAVAQDLDRVVFVAQKRLEEKGSP